MNRKAIEEELGAVLKEDLKELLDEAEREQTSKGGLSLGEWEKRARDGFRQSQVKLLEILMRENGSGYKGQNLRCECGELLNYQGNRELQVRTVAGDIKMKRAYYAEGKCGEGKAPLDEEMGISPRGWSPSIRQVMTLLGAETSFEKASELMYEVAGLIVSPDSIQRTAEDIGEKMALEQRDLESRVSTEDLKVPEKQVDRLYMAVDGMHSPIIKEGYKEVKLGSIFEAEKQAERLVAKNVTYLGGLIDAETFGERWKAQMLLRGGKYASEMVVLGDGIDWIWNQVLKHFPSAVQIIDWYHAKEYLYNVGWKLFGEGTEEGHKWVEARVKELWEGEIDKLLDALEAFKTKDEDKQRVIKNAKNYYGNNAHRMNYKLFRKKGYFIGSGVIEGACKSVAGRRLKISGARWRRDNTEKILHLRIYRASGWWDDFWKRYAHAA